MALIQCTECGKEISDKAAACPHCGAPADPRIGSNTYEASASVTPQTEPPQSSGWWKWVLGVPAGGLLLLMLIGSCSGNSSTKSAASGQRSAIELCWQEQAKKSNDPDTARFIAGTCEKMERDAGRR